MFRRTIIRSILIMKKTIWGVYIVLALHFPVVQASSLDCLKEKLSADSHFARAAFSEINSGTDIKSLSRIYTHLREATNNKLIKNVEAKRLINQEDWKKASHQLKKDAWRAYGNKTMNDWFKGREYVLSLPKEQTIDSDLIKKIHKTVTQSHKFHGFEGRRLLQRLRRGEISHEEFNILKKRVFENNEEIAGTPHSSLRGVYRQDPVDQIIHRGSSFKSDGSRYFTKNELEELRKNKYITVDENSIKQIGKNAYTGTARYEDVAKVGEAVESILKASEKKLKGAKTSREIIETVVSMEKDLISVHPFLDGNGRTVRLLGDYILSRYNLPPSLYPNESDLTMSLSEAVEFRLKGMRDYLREHQKELIEARQKDIKQETSSKVLESS